MPKLSTLHPNPTNPRTIKDANFERLVASIRDFPKMMALRPMVTDAESIKITGIYGIFSSIDNRFYIGSSVDMNRRRKEHFRKLKRGKHGNSHLQRFYDKHGEKALGFKILSEIINPTVSQLIAIEQLFIDNLNPLFNICKIANTRFGVKCSLEHRRKVSETRLAMRIKYDDEYKRKMSIKLSGENNPMFGMKGELSPNWGKKHTPETIKKMKQARQNQKITKQGIPQSAEATQKANITKRNRLIERTGGYDLLKNSEFIGIFASFGHIAEFIKVNPSSVIRAFHKKRLCKGFEIIKKGKNDR